MEFADDDLSPAEEEAFAALPESARLALLLHAREILSPLDPLTARQISQAAGVPLSRVERTLRIGLLKLRRTASERA
jgi:DNA-directed RNA polymerase specialized sigma24 family protein